MARRINEYDIVTVSKPVLAFYSDWRGHPRQMFTPQMEGVINGICRGEGGEGGYPEEVVIDFIGRMDTAFPTHPANVWRCRTETTNVTKIRTPKMSLDTRLKLVGGKRLITGLTG